MVKLEAEDIMPRVHAKLSSRYGAFEVISGQGIAKGQRIELEDNGRRVRCVIKTSSGGRISFGRRPDGTWSGLSECERVVVVAPTRLNGSDLLVSMFDQKVLLDAFEANLAAQKKAGMEKLPSWLAPFREDDRGPRGVGDGFGTKALWSEPLLTAPATLAAPTTKPLASVQNTVGGLTLAEAKEGLARTFGVSPDAIEIIIRG